MHDPRLIRFLAFHCLNGVAVGLGVLALLLYFNVAQLYDLVFAGDGGLIGLVLLCAGFSLTFGSLAMGTAIFLLPKGD